MRIGGFGGATGLADYLGQAGFAALIDATHPYATQMSRNAVQAATAAGIALLRVERPPWRAMPGDDWRAAADMAQAASLLAAAPRRVLLTIGQQDLAPFHAHAHDYVVRSIERPAPASLPNGALWLPIAFPLTEEAETTLLTEQRIAMMVTKNSGGGATAPKLAACRALGLPVVMIGRPPLPPAETVADAAAALAWLAHQAALRGA